MTQVATTPSQMAMRGVSSSFLWRRLHSLSGILPVGLFLLYHIYENMTALRGPEPYNAMVKEVNALLPRPYFYLLEVTAILGPLLFHALYGIYIASTGRSNVGAYAYGSNWAYWFQRASGYVAFIFIIVHVFVLRFWVTLAGHHLAPYSGPSGEDKLDLVTYADVSAHLGNPSQVVAKGLAAGNHIFVLCIVGSLLTIYHFSVATLNILFVMRFDGVGG